MGKVRRSPPLGMGDGPSIDRFKPPSTGGGFLLGWWGNAAAADLQALRACRAREASSRSSKWILVVPRI